MIPLFGNIRDSVINETNNFSVFISTAVSLGSIWLCRCRIEDTSAYIRGTIRSWVRYLNFSCHGDMFI